MGKKFINYNRISAGKCRKMIKIENYYLSNTTIITYSQSAPPKISIN